MSALRHAILGVGGVGGLIGACLAHVGDSVTLVVRPEALASYPEQLQLESASEISMCPLRAQPKSRPSMFSGLR